MAKKDGEIHENTDRGSKAEESKEPKSMIKPEETNQTEVKNASASGLGTMGRNDQQDEDESLTS